jgi:hypothetical protein
MTLHPDRTAGRQPANTDDDEVEGSGGSRSFDVAGEGPLAPGWATPGTPPAYVRGQGIEQHPTGGVLPVELAAPGVLTVRGRWPTRPT